MYRSNHLYHKQIKIFLYIFFLLIFLLKSINYYSNIDFKDPPDQYAHLSYIEYIKNSPFQFIPNFKDIKIKYSPRNDNGQMNYLSHPPLYYYLMTLVNDDTNIENYIKSLQSFNIIISTLSYILLLYIGYNMKVNILSHFGFLSLISSIPMVAYIGASINNDNLAMLSSMIFLIGLLKIFKTPNSRYSYLLISIGLLLGYFTKLTVFLLMFFTLIFLLFYFIKNKISIKGNIKYIITLTFIVFTPIIFYQLSIIIEYNSIVPSIRARSMEEYANSRFYVEESNRVFLTIWQWFQRLIAYWLTGWFGIMSEASFIKTISQIFSILILHFFTILALYYKCEKNDSYCLVGKIGFISILIVLSIQFYFSYNSHLSTGYLGGLQSRYFLPYLAIFAILCSLFINKINSKILQIFILLISLHAVYNDLLFTKIVLAYY